MPIKVIDLFAGPGGLGEGFSAYPTKGEKAFKIAISIEKDESAHRTLLLRAFYRQFEQNNLPVPKEYYEFLRGELGKNPEDELYKLEKFQSQLKQAQLEAQKIELGEDSQKDIYKNIRNAVGDDECILIGGPPCQAYSVVGRSRNQGDKNKKYVAKKDERNFLYLEYLKIIAKFQPKVFVMENVKGILSAKIGKKLIFSSILEDLEDPFKTTKVKPDSGREKHRYNIFSFVPKTGEIKKVNDNDQSLDPHDFIIRTENYGIPQARHRVILLGVRDDIASDLADFERLKPTKNNPPTVQEVLSDLPKLRSRLSKGIDTTENWREAVNGMSRYTLSQLSKDPLVPKKVHDKFKKNMDKICKSPVSIGKDKGLKKRAEFNKALPTKLVTWYKDKRLGKFVVNHDSRGHIESDLHRYLYYSTYASEMKKSPTSKNLPKVFWPDHKNFGSGKFADRFRVQLKKSAGTTVTCHISKDGHYFIHYDPSQCRSLTVREAARIQTFPDNYYFVGTRTQQYVQVGNAVPPYLALQIAETVFNILLYK